MSFPINLKTCPRDISIICTVYIFVFSAHTAHYKSEGAMNVSLQVYNYVALINSAVLKSNQQKTTV